MNGGAVGSSAGGFNWQRNFDHIYNNIQEQFAFFLPNAEDEDESEGGVERSGTTAAPTGVRPPTSKDRLFSLSSISLEISFDEVKKTTNYFHESNRLGSGSYGTVYKAQMADGTFVAVKLLDAPQAAGFDDEVKVLSRFRHPNLVILMGFARERVNTIGTNSSCLVYEYLEGGDCARRLMKSREGVIEFNARQRVSVLLDCAMGLSHLHNSKPKAFHRDIKTPNILLDKNGGAKMADFGLACVTNKGVEKKVEQVSGTVGYACPYYIRSGVVTEHSETYSFGMVILEMLTGRAPAWESAVRPGEYDFLLDEINQSVENVMNMLDETAYWPHPIARQLIDLAFACACRAPAERINFIAIVQCLRNLLNSVESIDYRSDFDSLYKVGAKVSCKWKNTSIDFQGVISKVNLNGSCTITYTDNEVETDVPFARITITEPAPPPPAPPPPLPPPAPTILFANQAPDMLGTLLPEDLAKNGQVVLDRLGPRGNPLPPVRESRELSADKTRLELLPGKDGKDVIRIKNGHPQHEERGGQAKVKPSPKPPPPPPRQQQQQQQKNVKSPPSVSSEVDPRVLYARDNPPEEWRCRLLCAHPDPSLAIYIQNDVVVGRGHHPYKLWDEMFTPEEVKTVSRDHFEIQAQSSSSSSSFKIHCKGMNGMYLNRELIGAGVSRELWHGDELSLSAEGNGQKPFFQFVFELRPWIPTTPDEQEATPLGDIQPSSGRWSIEPTDDRSRDDLDLFCLEVFGGSASSTSSGKGRPSGVRPGLDASQRQISFAQPQRIGTSVAALRIGAYQERFWDRVLMKKWSTIIARSHFEIHSTRVSNPEINERERWFFTLKVLEPITFNRTLELGVGEEQKLTMGDVITFPRGLAEVHMTFIDLHYLPPEDTSVGDALGTRKSGQSKPADPPQDSVTMPAMHIKQTTPSSTTTPCALERLCPSSEEEPPSSRSTELAPNDRTTYGESPEERATILAPPSPKLNHALIQRTLPALDMGDDLPESGDDCTPQGLVATEALRPPVAITRDEDFTW